MSANAPATTHLYSWLPEASSLAAGEANSVILDRFLEYCRDRKTELYPAQEEAILALLEVQNVILNTPTGSGKSLVATALHFQAIALGRRSVYTSPIKALVNEKFLQLCRDFGPEQVGMITGDASVNSSAPIICCTAEILAIDALRMGAEANVHDVIMDEFHYYSDRERGMAWQVPLLTLKNARFLLMSATLGDTDFFERELTALNGRPTLTVRSTVRPVPLEFIYSEDPLHETVPKLITRGRAPIYVVSFTQRECAEVAQNFLSIDFCTKDEKRAIASALEGVKFSSPYGKEIQKLIRHGIGIHHAGLLPKYRILVESLAQKGLLKLICGTDTLGVGVNVPIRTVLLTQLCKFDGTKSGILSVRDFHQISGRAGRKGFDELGTVVAQAPEHVIENLQMERKAAGDPKKIKKIVKRKPPEKGYVAWSQETFKKLIDGTPEPLISRFEVKHGTLLAVLGRPTGGCEAMRELIRRSHESEVAKKHHRKKAFALFRSLVDRKIIELNPLRLNVDLQVDFSLHHALSLYLIDTIDLIDPMSADYSVNLLTLVESIIEDPDVVLRKQLDRLKTQRMSEMKMDGIDFDERIEKLEQLEYPKPNRDFIYSTFNEFAARHPWVGQENIQPKSIAREMYEGFYSFAEYIREYGLQRSEGVLLRYLSEVYKTVVQSIPERAKSEELLSIEEYFGPMLRSTDSSLIDEWERLRNPGRTVIGQSATQADAQLAQAESNAREHRRLQLLIRNEVFRLVRILSQGQIEDALEFLSDHAVPGARVWTKTEIEQALDAYFETHARMSTDPEARNPQNLRCPFKPGDLMATGEQILCDPDSHNDWHLTFDIDLQATQAAQSLRWSLHQIASL